MINSNSSLPQGQLEYPGYAIEVKDKLAEVS